ncbi:MAG: CbiQ family ECF transporter T component [Mycoplasmatales bacterium]
MKIDGRLKFLYLIAMFILIFVATNIKDFFILYMFTFLLMIVTKFKFTNFKKYLPFIISICFFIFIFNLFLNKDLYLSSLRALDTLLKMFLILLFSIMYKQTTNIRDIAYAISYYLIPLRIFGYNQKKLYTLLMLTLNEILVLVEDLKEMEKYEKLKKPYINKKDKIKRTIKLIMPFFSKTIYKNEIITISLLSKGYNQKDKHIKFYQINKNNNKLVIILIIMYMLQVYLMGV